MFGYRGTALALRLAINVGAALLMGCGISIYYATGLGADPVSVLMEGLAGHLGLTAGTVTSGFNCLVVVAFWFARRKLVGLGTVIQALLVGVGIDLGAMLWGRVLPAALPLPAGLLMSLGGALVCGCALALYLACDLGASAVDMLVLTVGEGIKRSYKWGFYLVYAVFLLLGILLGGRWGVGTLIALAVTGQVTDFLMPRIRARLGRAAE